MNKIEATLTPDADGMLRIPLPPELRQGLVRITAAVEAVEVADSEDAEAQRKRELRAAMEKIWELNPFQGIGHPVAWQREMREDRALP